MPDGAPSGRSSAPCCGTGARSRPAITTSAYDRLAPELQEAFQGRTRWIRAIRRDGLYSVDIAVEPTLTTEKTATARVVRMRTRAARTGCKDWSGTYTLRKVNGAWRISKAGMKSRKC